MTNMTPLQKQQQLQKLANVTKREWREAQDVLARHITIRLKGFIVHKPLGTPTLVGGITRYGAHSESNLTINALTYYIEEAVLKLYRCKWQWKDGRSLSEQLIIIVDNLIQKNVESHKRNPPETPPEEVDIETIGSDDSPDYNPDTGIESDPYYLQARQAVMHDPQLLAFVDAIVDCNSTDEICARLKTTKDQVYNLTKRLKRIWYKNKTK